MFKRALIVSATLVALLVFSVTAFASPPDNAAVTAGDNGLELPNCASQYAAGNPMDVPGIR